MVAGTGVEPVIFELMRLAWLSVPLARNNLVGKAGTRTRVLAYPKRGALATRPLPVNLVGMGGFEPPPPCSQSRWATVTLHPENLERLAGIEPVVESLEDSYSAIELQPRILERSAGIEPAPRHWQCRILPLNHDRPILVDAGEVESPLPVCRTGVLPLSLRAQILVPSPAWDSGTSGL